MFPHHRRTILTPQHICLAFCCVYYCNGRRCDVLFYPYVFYSQPPCVFATPAPLFKGSCCSQVWVKRSLLILNEVTNYVVSIVPKTPTDTSRVTKLFSAGN